MFQTMHLWVSTARCGSYFLTLCTYISALVNQALRLTSDGQTGLTVGQLPTPARRALPGIPVRIMDLSLRGGAASFTSYALDQRLWPPDTPDQD